MSLKDYQKKGLREHIYDTPDTYVGGSEMIEETSFIWNGTNIELQSIQYVPAILSIFNEVLVNARDQKVRLDQLKSNNPVQNIKVTYDPSTYMWSIYNDGEGVDVALHPTEKDDQGNPIYIPELIFGNLLTSKNYNKQEKKIVGGKNGYGAKLVNIFSQWFKIETVDSVRKLKYSQEFSNNMTKKKKPKVATYKQKSYTKISWILDFQRFGIQTYNEDMISLMKKRVYDISGITDRKVNVYLNQEKLAIKTFSSYIQLYSTDSLHTIELSDRWSMGITISPKDKFEQISFVNGICTSKGGKHVDTVVKQIVQGIQTYIKKKEKKDIPENYIKNNIKLFLNSVIENPSFDSQTKERLITPATKFGSKVVITDKHIKEIVQKTEIVSKVLSFADFKENKQAKKTDGSKRNKINVPKLDDANWAGTKHSHKCTLILTEGDSAKTMAISGLSVVGRDAYGVFPLRGKILNVKDASTNQINSNAEITNLKKILGLETGKVYHDVKSLRYGQIMIMTDQDHDGSHIKGLLINIFQSLWPSLLQLKTPFLTAMITPIIKVTKSKQSKSFYTLQDYHQWKDETANASSWNIKYYKGLGTSNTSEAKDYFKHILKNNFIWTEESNINVDLAFKKDQSDLRKTWLTNYNEEETIDPKQVNIPIETFIHKELIHFSNSDAKRSIGSVCDGLKPSQRKILYCCFKRKLYSEIRVAQLAGYVSEHAAYHHGEASLQSTIIGMAQTFVGTNNIHCLQPNGQFGSRIMGGADSASPRYIHTELNRIMDVIFPKLDFPCLSYVDDDGIFVEPTYYVPIIPFVLVNGMTGIGTGFSTNIPQFNPVDVIGNVLRKLDKKPYKKMKPWYKGFQGKIKEISSQKYMTKGIYKKLKKDTIEITELPIGVWTANYKTFLDSLLVGGVEKGKKQPFTIRDYQDHSTDSTVHFIIKVDPQILESNTYHTDDHMDTIEKMFKLTSTKQTSLTNIHLYNSNNQIQKYKTIYHILDEHYNVRYKLYEVRKEYLLKTLKEELDILKQKIRFMNQVMKEEIHIYRKKKEDIIQKLIELNYKKHQDSYQYLLSMPIYNFTEEKLIELEKDIQTRQEEYDCLYNLSIVDYWKQELNALLGKLK